MKRVGVLVIAGVALVGGALAAAARWAPAAIQPAAARAELTRLISSAIDNVDLGDWSSQERPPFRQVAMREDQSTGRSKPATNRTTGLDSPRPPTIATTASACEVPGYSINTTSGVQLARVDQWVAAPQVCMDLTSISTVSGELMKADKGPCRVHVVLLSETRDGWRAESRIVRGLGKS